MASFRTSNIYFKKSKIETILDKIIGFFIEEEKEDRMMLGLKIVIRIFSFFMIYYLYTSHILPFSIASNVSSYVETVFTVLFIFDFLALFVKDSDLIAYIRGFWKMFTTFPIVTLPILVIIIYAITFRVEGFGYIDPALLVVLGTVFLFDGAFTLFYSVKTKQGIFRTLIDLLILIQGIILIDMALFYTRPIPLWDYYSSLSQYFHYVL